MKISERFDLKKSQAELDFIDIDPEYDIPLFIDSHLIGVSDHPFSNICHLTISNFFNFFLELVRQGEREQARELFSYLHEPNETCLGISRGKPNGRGVGRHQATEIFESIMNSRAIQTGVLDDLEDFRIFVHGIGPDKGSDMATNIIRKNLIEYSKQQCNLHGIPLQRMVATGPYWNPLTRRWEHSHEDILVIDDRAILLVPKCIVSYGRGYSFERYHRHFVLSFVRKEHLRSNGPYVRRRELKNGKEKVWVTKEDMARYVAPPNKDFISGYTQQHRHLFEKFKEQAALSAKPLKDQQINKSLSVKDICIHLINNLINILPGNETASEYHKLIIGILELIFYPNLTCPRKEKEIYEGRKRIDIMFDNSAKEGEFYRLHMLRKIPCTYIMVECKNYSKDVTNPELDQLSGRLSIKNGQFGILVCRAVQDYPTLIARCRDAYNAKNELMIPILDEDLISILEAKANDENSRPEEEFIRNRIQEIVLSAPRLAKAKPAKRTSNRKK